MADLFVLALLGHLIGDYLLQTKHMAFHKSEPGWIGIRTCSFHVFVYTVAICLATGVTRPVTVALIFLPHWIIDRWSLATKWLKLIRGRTFEKAYSSTDKYREFDIAFTSIVYTVVDNTLHLLCLWVVIKFLITR